MFEDGTFFWKILNPEGYWYWFKSYGDFAEWFDFAYWWSFGGEGSAPTACAAGLFIILDNFFWQLPITLKAKPY